MPYYSEERKAAILKKLLPSYNCNGHLNLVTVSKLAK